MRRKSVRPLGPRKTLAELAYQRLRDGIIHGRLQPGELISTGQIARAMHISSMPVRAALTRLEAEGLVVSSISTAELEELFATRSRLEGLAVHLACRHLTESDLRKFRQYLRDMARYTRAKDAKRWLATNEQWHHLIFRASRNEQLERLLFDLWHRGIRRRTGAPNVPGHMERRNAEHAAILAALEERNAELAERLWRDHILAGGEEIIKFLTQTQLRESAPTRGR
ncbi:MAG: GntR family transcriptional regulator [candidate division NC10 bacterium]|nr:GntR family transcriptional regulator [candidate division NC10 bacterium]